MRPLVLLATLVALPAASEAPTFDSRRAWDEFAELTRIGYACFDVVGGRWTGSMGEGLMIGFDALGATTVGSPLGHLLGAIEAITLAECSGRIDLPIEQLFHVNGTPREAFRPTLAVEPTERSAAGDPALKAIREALR